MEKMDIDTKWKNKLRRMDEDAFGSLMPEIYAVANELEGEHDFDATRVRVEILKNVAREIALRIESSEYLSDRLKKD